MRVRVKKGPFNQNVGIGAERHLVVHQTGDTAEVSMQTYDKFSHALEPLDFNDELALAIRREAAGGGKPRARPGDEVLDDEETSVERLISDGGHDLPATDEARATPPKASGAGKKNRRRSSVPAADIEP